MMLALCSLLLLVVNTVVPKVGAQCDISSIGLAPIDFIVIESDAVGIAIEDNIRATLEELGYTVNTRLLSKEDFNTQHTTGNFSLSFTETWGAPYDPYSYTAGWIANDEGHFSAFSNLDGDSSRDELFDLIRDVTREENVATRTLKWAAIHQYYHEQAVMLPLWGKRVPAVINGRLQGYEAGYQQFDYPVQTLVPVSGSKTVTIAPGAQTGMFQSVGRLDPHTYRPNEFFSNNWVYEGLVSYGEGGQLLPALAVSWSIEDNSDGGETFTFNLRSNVLFHDGTAWNCAAAKLNFDHVFAGGLKGPNWHGWYGLPGVLKSWDCAGDLQFRVVTTRKYAPFLQELSFIRPLRMLSPASFSQGLSSDPFTHNSCHVGWGEVTSADFPTVTCAGITAPSGTGPFVFDSRDVELSESGEPTGNDNQVTFVRNTQYWGSVPEIETLIVVRYETSDEVVAALLDGSLDIMWGSGVIADKEVATIRDDPTNNIQVFIGDDIQNVIMLLNSGKPPLDKLATRRAIVHAVDRASIIQEELGGLQSVVNQVFPLDAPYCDVDLTPKFIFNKALADAFSFQGCPVYCLPSEAMVHVKGRGDVALENVQIGDAIYTGQGVYEQVYSFGHRNTQKDGQYLAITMEGLEMPLEVSLDHLVFQEDGKTVPASGVRVGDRLMLGSLTERASSAEVTKVREVTKRGAMAPFSPSGKFVSNGVVVSSYTTILDNNSASIGGFSVQWLANVFEAPHRMVCAIHFDTCKNETYDADGVSNWVSSPRQFFVWVLQQHPGLQLLVFVPVVSIAVLVWMVELFFSHSSSAYTFLCLVAAIGWMSVKGKSKP